MNHLARNLNFTFKICAKKIPAKTVKIFIFAPNTASVLLDPQQQMFE